MKKYNIAFIPKNKITDILNLIEENINWHEGYIIGRNSIPHVTVCQFQTKEEQLDSLINTFRKDLIDTNLELDFKRLVTYRLIQ